MKKAKFILKVNNNYATKIYLNKKWLKDKNVTKLKLEAVPWIYKLEIEQYKLNEKGLPYAENDEIVKENHTYKFGRK